MSIIPDARGYRSGTCTPYLARYWGAQRSQSIGCSTKQGRSLVALGFFGHTTAFFIQQRCLFDPIFPGISRLTEGSTSIEIRSVIKSGTDLATEGVIETRITVDTSLRNQYDIAGSLAWLAATIRTSKNEALTKSKVQFVFQDLLSNEADASYRLILEPLEDSDGAPCNVLASTLRQCRPRCSISYCRAHSWLWY